MNRVTGYLDTMDYAPAPESPEAALAWIREHGPVFDHWIKGQPHATAGGGRFELFNPATGERIAQVAVGDATDVDAAVAAARAAFPAWSGLSGAARARHLYALARQVQRHARLLATLESLDNGKPIRETRDLDIPLVARHFYHHAGWAQLAETELAGFEPLGVCGQIIPWNFPLLMLAWKVAPALAAGNTVVLKPAEHTPLSALCFAHLASEAGLPPGVLNILTGEGETGALLCRHPGVDKVAFTGSTDVGREIRRATAGSGKRLTLELGGKSPFLVFPDADIDSAIEGLVDAIWLNQGQVCCAGSRLLVQESIADDFHKRLRQRMGRLRVGDPLDKAIDIGAIVAPVQLDRIRELCALGVAEGADCWQPAIAMPDRGSFFPPTLFADVAPAATIAREEIFGPVLVSMRFRTPEEAIALANDTRYGLAASVWSQDLDTALEVARRIRAGTVWVNCTNMFDAASGFGGYQESGFGREGGLEGLRAYLRPLPGPARAGNGLEMRQDARLEQISQARTALGSEASDEAASHSNSRTDSASNSASDSEPDSASASKLPAVDRTAKLYIGGRQRRPDGGYSRAVHSPAGALLAYAGEGNRKDVRDAVEAARNAEAWSRMSGHGRAQVLYYLGENLEARSGAICARIAEMFDQGHESGRRDRRADSFDRSGSHRDRAGAAASAELAAAVDACFTWAAWADKWDGAVHDTPMRGLVAAIHEALGVVGVVCPNAAPLSALLGLAGPLLATGNRVVLLPSESNPLVAVELYQVLEASDLPGGVLNLITGSQASLSAVLAEHDDVDGLWFAGDGPGSEDIATDCEGRSASNLKPCWRIAPGLNWQVRDAGFERERLRRATQVKNIWLPHGI